MKLYFNNTELDIILDNDSYRYRAIQGDNSLTLKFASVSHIDIPVGATCVFQGEEYTLTSDENLTMVNSENFEYTLLMDSQKYKLDKWKFKNTVDKRLKFNLTAKPIEHLQMLVDNLNQRDNGWQVGECVDSAEKYIGYNHAYCIDALKQMASEFETEYYIDNKTIGLKKLELNKEDPISLAYGKGNGFLGDIKREVQSDETPIEILYTQGGTRNIDFSTYGNSELLLPKNQTIKFDGEYFEGETEFNPTNSREYITDSDGFGIQRNDKTLTTKSEDSLDLSNIYPQRVGTISDVLTYDDLYDIVDNSIPASLNFNDYQIAGETMTIIFQSGMLAGKEFEVNYKHDAGDLAGRRFEIVNQEIDGETMPNTTFAPQIGDTYSVFHVALPPQDYISNDTLKIGASWDMFKEGVKYLYEHENQQFSISGTLDKIWAKSDWENIGGKLVLGGYVLFSDRHFQDDDLLIRIVGIKDFINNPHAPEIELSNTPISTSVSTTLKKIDSNEEVTENLHKEALSFTKRRYRDSAETISLLENAMLTNYTASISPITIKAMQLMVGDESLQFRFVNSLTDLTQKNLDLTYLNGILDVGKSYIQHMTLGINTISPIHDNYLTWEVNAFTSPYLDEVDKAYYFYAKVSKVDNTGSFVLSENPITMEQVSGYYHLLVGLLNSEYDGTRSFVPMYGFTEVLPGRITTDKIVSTDGKTYFDLINGIIGGKITFTNSSGDEEFVSDLEDSLTEAYKSYADAAKEAAETTAAAYADGIVDDEEQARINDANAKLATAKAYADAQDALLKTQQEAYADGKISTSEQASINAAKAYADLKKTEANTYADGIVSAEEERAIADATAKFDDAKSHADSLVDNIEIGGRNLIIRSTETKGIVIGLSGDIKSSAGNDTSDYIGVSDTQSYFFTKKESSIVSGAGFFRYAWYGEDKAYMGRVANSSNSFQWLPPSGVNYVRISYPSDSYPKFEKGNKATDWTPAPEDVQSYADAMKEAAIVDAGINADGKITASEAKIKTAYETYTNTAKAAAISTANSYADGKVTDAEAALTTAYTNLVNAEKQKAIDTANAYADDKISDEEQARLDADEAITTAYTTAVSVAKAAAIQEADANADGKITASEAATKVAYDKAIAAAKKLAEDTAAAYADGIVDDEEQARLAADEAITTAYTTAVNAAKDAAVQEADANADGKITESEAKVTTAYKSYADAAKAAAETTAKAYADGIVDDEEQARINDANAKLAEAKEHAEELADGKSTTFVDTPTTPYHVGDLFVDGSDLRRCTVERLTGAYNATDWGAATNYDNTTVTIDNGIVTAGSMQVGGADGFIKAGITGDGTSEDSVRFFAGDTFANRNTAPFRVYQSGKTVQTDGEFNGTIVADRGSIGSFEIHDSFLGVPASAVDENGNTYTPDGMHLYPSMIGFNETGRRVIVGTTSSLGYPYLANFTDTKAGVVRKIGLGITVSGSTGDNLAIAVGAGKFQNYNMPIRIVDSNTTLSEADTYVVANSTSNITITLPNLGVEQDGHVFYIKQCTSSRVVISAAYGIDIFDADGNLGSDTLDSKGTTRFYIWSYSLQQYLGSKMI